MKKLILIFLLFLVSCNSINSPTTVELEENEEVLNVYSTSRSSVVVIKNTKTKEVYTKAINFGFLTNKILIIKQNGNVQTSNSY